MIHRNIYPVKGLPREHTTVGARNSEGSVIMTRIYKKTLSVLLALALVCGVFAVCAPVKAAADTTVTGFVRKWVQADHVTGDYYSFYDLYSNFIVCRVDRNASTAFSSSVFDTTQAAIDARTGTITLLNGNNTPNGNQVILDGLNGNDFTYSWRSDNTQGDGKIYLSTHEDNGTNFNSGDYDWWAYTWEVNNNLTLNAEVPATSNADGMQAYYTSGAHSGYRYFVSTGHNGPSGFTEYTEYTQIPSIDGLVIHYYGEPTWSWAADHSSATATFTCAQNDSTQTENATVTTSYGNGKKYTATVNFNGTDYTDMENVRLFKGNTATLSSEISLDFYFDNTEAESKLHHIDFTWDVANSSSGSEVTNSKSKTVALADMSTQSGTNYKIASCPIAAAEMTSTVTATAYDENGTVLDTATNSVKGYASELLSKTASELNQSDQKHTAMCNLVKAMLNYGASAQRLFSRNTSNYANVDMGYTEAELSSADLETEKTAITSLAKQTVADISGDFFTGAKYYQSNLVLNGKTSYTIYFTGLGSISSVTATVGTNNTPYSVENSTSGSLAVVKVKDLTPVDLMEDIVLSITVSDVSKNATFNVADYMYFALDPTVNTDENLADTVRHIYRYSTAASAYASAT